jgi:hypothetical protein
VFVVLCIIIIIIIIIIMTHCARTAPSAWVWRLAAEGSSPPCWNVFHVVGGCSRCPCVLQSDLWLLLRIEDGS